jgi:hypothetical protein
MNQTFPEYNTQPQFTLPKESAPNVPINIYENIELIKQQIAARTKMIQTQGTAIPADKLRILQKQNEIQNQILIQKMAIAKKMEQTEQEQLRQKEQDLQRQMSQMALPSMNEPEFIYEKGIPRKNPNYKTPEEIEAIKQARAMGQAQARAAARGQTLPQQAHPQAHPQAQSSSRMTPFVSMITDTGVIPPPIVILKSHDAKLAEHDNVIQEMIQQLDYLLENVKESSAPGSTAGATSDAARAHAATAQEGEHEGDAEADEPEQELLMEVVMNDLTNSREFVEGIVDKIVNDTNLSEVIMKIEPLVKENQELRSLIHSQQQMMNEMNTMLLRLLNSNGSVSAPSQTSEQVVFQDDGLDNDGLYSTEMAEIVLSIPGVVNDGDAEPAKIIDIDETVETVDTVEQVESTEAVEPVEATEPEPTEVEVEADAQADAQAQAEADAEVEAEDDSYSEMPHFPIALVVNEI